MNKCTECPNTIGCSLDPNYDHGCNAKPKPKKMSFLFKFCLLWAIIFFGGPLLLFILFILFLILS